MVMIIKSKREGEKCYVSAQIRPEMHAKLGF